MAGKLACTDCVSVTKLAGQLNVRPTLLRTLATTGRIAAHHHNGRVSIAKSDADDLRWEIAMARERWSNAA